MAALPLHRQPFFQPQFHGAPFQVSSDFRSQGRNVGQLGEHKLPLMPGLCFSWEQAPGCLWGQLVGRGSTLDTLGWGDQFQRGRRVG